MLVSLLSLFHYLSVKFATIIGSTRQQSPSLSFPVQQMPHRILGAAWLLGTPNDFLCPELSRGEGTGLHIFVNRWSSKLRSLPLQLGVIFTSFLENASRAVCLFHTASPTGHMSLCVTNKSCFFLPLGLQGDTVSFSASPDAQHKVTSCSK